MTTEENKAIVQREFDELWNGNNLGMIDTLFAPTYIGHDSGSPEPLHGRAGARQLFEQTRAALSDLQATIDELVAERDKVVVWWTTRGTHRGELLGVAPAGKPVTLTGISILRMGGDRIAEEWTTWDAWGV